MYRSRTVFEDATPEFVRDFFSDDEFRLQWDPMLTHFKILEESTRTGETVVHWIKKVCTNSYSKSCVLACSVLLLIFFLHMSEMNELEFAGNCMRVEDALPPLK